MAQLTDSEILTVCRRESYNAESYVTSEISDDREDTLERYMGEYYGDEVSGKSQVISRDVFEVIEWIMPDLVKTFTGSDDIVKFEPQGPEDEAFADQATDYVNYIFNKDNKGFLILDSWFKDALLQKMGVVKSYWEDKTRTEGEEYESLTDDEYFYFLNDEDVKITEHNEEPLMSPEGFMVGSLHHIKLTRTIVDGRTSIEGVPPEEFYMSYEASDIDKAKYLEHRRSVTKSELLEDGYDADIVEKLPFESSNDPTGERQNRMGQQNEYEEHADDSMKEVTVHESYVSMDVDNDGIAERWKVIWVGSTILEKEQVSHQPFSELTPIKIPHRAYGMSFADVLVDLQRIKTTLMRQTLDNLYLANNPEREVVMDQIYDMDDFLTSRAGGIKRVKALNASREISHPFVAQHSFAMLDGIDGIITRRTGISDTSMGSQESIVANQSATASDNVYQAANKRIDYIARIFAETGVKHLFRNILRITCEHQDRERVVRLRNEWVPMDPRDWNAEMDVSIDVGLGNSNKDKQAAHLNNILNLQQQIIQAPQMAMVNPENIYNTLEKMVHSAGFKNVEPFFMKPKEGPLPQPEQQPNPQDGVIQAQMQIEGAKIQANAQKSQQDHQIKLAELEIDREKIKIEREKIGAGLKETAAKIQSDEDKAAQKLQADAKALLLKNEQDNMKDALARIDKENEREREPVVVNVGGGQKQVKVSRDAEGNMVGSIE